MASRRVAKAASRGPRRTQTPVASVAFAGPVGPVADDARVIERIVVTPDDRLLLTPAEAARRLSISRALCYRLIGSGELPSLVIGAKLRRVPVQALNTYIQTQMQAAAGL